MQQTSIYDILHRMGFSSRRPWPRHPESASESAQTAFKKKLEGMWDTMPQGDTGHYH